MHIAPRVGANEVKIYSDEIKSAEPSKLLGDVTPAALANTPLPRSQWRR